MYGKLSDLLQENKTSSFIDLLELYGFGINIFVLVKRYLWNVFLRIMLKRLIILLKIIVIL